MDLVDYATHSPFSDPGAHAPLLDAVGTDPDSLHRAVTRTILHYRGEAARLTPEQLRDVDSRWVATILDVATQRQPGPLDAVRPDACVVGGCCRDHALLAVAILRQHGIPARTRLGFAGYFEAGYAHDHVVAERWDGARWVRFDPELGQDDFPFDVHDLPTGEGAPFETAAEAWTAYRAGRTDLATYGVAPGAVGLEGPSFVQRYVLADVAHRHRCETLLWDGWGAMVPLGEEPDDEQLALGDELARLTVAADADPDPDGEAAGALGALWATDPRVNPGGKVLTFPPLDPDAPPRVVDLTTAPR
ncbi:transglutaminase-like domain-containing protein [Luteimicrobium sp. DT211]|uniref:transglutaminase-like domain-containing protein n=1 Tax=Luteimicrobium sp. DT211 TaxID=3393412 RepID=UPI003CF492F8